MLADEPPLEPEPEPLLPCEPLLELPVPDPELLELPNEGEPLLDGEDPSSPCWPLDASSSSKPPELLLPHPTTPSADTSTAHGHAPRTAKRLIACARCS